MVDGIADTAYGTALSVQNTNTQFGDANTGDPVNGGFGSEIDQVFGKVANGRLYVMIAGNLEKNFNKMEVFVDSKAGGVNTIDGASLPTGVDAFCCGGFGTTSGALQRMNGLTFDAGFNADYLVTFSNGFESVGPFTDPPTNQRRETQFWAVSAHYADMTQGAAGAVVAAGVQYAYDGLPRVLRFPGDYNDSGSVDAADYTKWRNTLARPLPVAAEPTPMEIRRSRRRITTFGIRDSAATPRWPVSPSSQIIWPTVSPKRCLARPCRDGAKASSSIALTPKRERRMQRRQ